MENIYSKSLTLYTELGLTSANQENNTVDKLGPVPSETPFQSLFFVFVIFFKKLHLYCTQYHLTKLNTNIESYVLSS